MAAHTFAPEENAGEDAFLLRQPPRHREGRHRSHLKHSAICLIALSVLQMKVFGNKARPRPLNLCARASTADLPTSAEITGESFGSTAIAWNDGLRA